jgi:hypothetical protein
MDEYRRDLVLAYLCRFPVPRWMQMDPRASSSREGPGLSPPSVPRRPAGNIAATLPAIPVRCWWAAPAATGTRQAREAEQRDERPEQSSSCWAAFRIFELGLTLAG